MGSTIRDVGARFSKFSGLILGFSSSDDEMQGHRTGKILYHSSINMGVGGFIWDQCSLSEVVVIIIVINIVSPSIICLGGISVSIMLS